MLKLKNRTLGLIAAVAMAVGTSHGAFAAMTLTLAVGAGGSATDHILGEVIPGLQSGGLADRDQVMVNTLLGMSPGQRTPSGTNPKIIVRRRFYGSLPSATQTGMAAAGGIGDMTALAQYISIQLPSTIGYQVLGGCLRWAQW